MRLFLNDFLIISLALLCLIIGCGETENPLQPIDITDKHFHTIAETKTPPLTTVPAAPKAPPTDGTPFVQSVSYYANWKLTEPITGTVAPGTTFFTKVVFSEPMAFTAADDKTARPILYYQIDGERTRYRIAKHRASGEDFQSGDAKPKGGGTQTFVCKYTVPAEATGIFTIAIGRLNTDQDGNTLPAFYVHSTKLRLEHPRQPDDIRLSSHTLDENNAPSTVIGTFETQGDDRFSYQMIRGPGHYFQVNKNNELVAKYALNHEHTASFEITIREKDKETGKSITKEFTILINDLNEAPTDLLLSGTTLSEDAPRGTVIGFLTAVDEDAEDMHTFQLIEGSEYFEVAGNLLRLHEPFPGVSERILIEVTDKEDETYSKAFIVQKVGVVDAPGDNAGASGDNAGASGDNAGASGDNTGASGDDPPPEAPREPPQTNPEPPEQNPPPETPSEPPPTNPDPPPLGGDPGEGDDPN